MDNLQVCDRCGSDACYVTEVNHEIKNYHCYGCGFQTNSLMRREHDFFKQQMETLPNLYKELMGEDEEGKIWMPSTTNLPGKGMVFAKGNNASNWKWASVLLKEVDGKEKMDLSTMKEFEERDFMEALDYIGVFEKVN